MDTVKIKLIRSPIGYNPKIRKTVSALGFSKMHQVLEKKKNPAVLGMVKKIEFMLEILDK